MKRYGQLWEKLISWDNLVLAARKAQRGKRDRVSVQSFNFNLETGLLRLQTALWDRGYRPGAFRTHWITCPKPRMISVAPYRDRVVHHALMNILEPILDRHFHPHNYACRKDKGTLAAANRLQTLMHKYHYALQCDIRKFFPSIDHELMKSIFRHLFKDKNALWLMDLIVDNSNEQAGTLQWFAGDDLFIPLDRRKGLPIGNLTSQWFANWYLNGLDHFITSQLRIGAYVRYCDDFIVLDNDRQRLQDARRQIDGYLTSIRLKLHPNKVFIRPVASGLVFVGYRLWRSHRFLKKANIRTFRRRLRWIKAAYACGKLEWDGVKRRLDSWMGYASHSDCKYLIRQLSKEWKFTRDRTDHESCCPGRQLEQQCNELHGDQPQQQHAIQSQQQHRISSRPALSEDNCFFTRNHEVYGPFERGVESPGAVPELRLEKTDSRMIVLRPDGAGRIFRTSHPDMKRRCA